jgi:HEAT repeat protein
MSAVEPPRVDHAGLGEVVRDPVELQKGIALLEAGGLAHLARHGSALFAEAVGGGMAPYKITVRFGAADVKARCGCPAARTRPMCKHAAALVVAWARMPEAFVVSERAPVDAGRPRRRAVKRGDHAVADEMRAGVLRLQTLLAELGLSGVATLGQDRALQIAMLGDTLRDQRLRRLAGRTAALARLLREDPPPSTAIMDLVADLSLATKRVLRHLDGQALEDRYVEVLIGKTWRKADRAPVGPLDLVEYAHATWETADGFVVRESRFVSLDDGAHYAEKQIVPGFLARRTEPLPPRGGLVLGGARGSRYPGFAPLRLDLEAIEAPRPLDRAALARVVEVALPSAGAALSALQERRRDLFAPARLPVAFRAELLVARGGRLLALDEGGRALFLVEDAALAERIAAALRGRALRVLLGELDVIDALPTLIPQAAIAEEDGGELQLVRLSSGGALAPPSDEREGRRWSDAARAAGASAAAVSLAEIREELADAFVAGLTSLGPRVTAPLVARLADLGLDKQAALLEEIAGRAPEARLDDLVKLYQVLEIAIVRLVATPEIDRAALVPAPLWPSVLTAPLEGAPDDPATVAARRAGGELDRYQAALHHARYFEALDDSRLTEIAPAAFADGSAAPFVVRAVAARGEAAAAPGGPIRRVLERPVGRTARATAIAALEAIPGDAAARMLADLLAAAEAARTRDVVLARLAADALEAREARRLPAAKEAIAAKRRERTESRRRLEQQLRRAPRGDLRRAAVEGLVALADRDALPALREAYAGDAAAEVRRAAATALGALLDADSVDALARTVALRDTPAVRPDEARAAAAALALMGDLRALPVILDAIVAGWRSPALGDALLATGAAAADPLAAAVAAHPELATRKAVARLLGRVATPPRTRPTPVEKRGG